VALLKKKIRGRTYYYYTETKRVNGKPKLVKQVYLGPAEEIYRRLSRRGCPAPEASPFFTTVEVVRLRHPPRGPALPPVQTCAAAPCGGEWPALAVGPPPW